MKKILHVSKYYYPFKGGIEQIAQDCVKALSGNYSQKVFCFNHENGDCVDQIDDVDIIRCGCFAKVSSQSLSLSYCKRLKNTINSFRPDIIIFHYPNPFAAFWILKYVPAKAKLVIYWHLDIVKQKFLGKFFVVQNWMLLDKAELIVATSSKYVDGSKYLCKYKQKCTIVSNCINESRLKPTTESENIAKKIKAANEGKIICLAVGRHTEYKGFKYLIRASKLLNEKFVVYIAGKGEQTDVLKREAKEDKKIHFLGAVSDDELKAYFSCMDIFCFPSISKNEAFGLALAEGMYFEKPTVTFTIPGSGVNYVSLNGVTGIEVENGNIKEYANAIIKLAEDEKLRKKYGQAGKKRVVEKFLSSQFGDSIRKVVGEL